ncbi:hypothetical protein Tco_0210093, partial [Tanacetum coccineum]
MNELVNDSINLSKHEINIGFINALPKKWLSFCQSLRSTNHVKDSELASLFGKLKYKENLIDSIYETEKKKSLTTATPLSTSFFSTSIVQDFQDSPDDEEDTRSGQEYLNDLEEEYQERALLAKSKRFFKKGSQRFSGAREIDETICHKCGKKVKAKLALLSSSASSSKSAMVKNKGLVAEAYEWDEEDVSSDDNEMAEVKVLMTLADDENIVVGKESARNGEWVKISMRKVHTLLEMEDNDERKTFIDYLCIDLNYVEEQRNNLMLKHRSESQMKVADPSVTVTDSSAIDYDLADESSVCSTPLPPLEKLASVEHVYGSKTIKSILKSNSTFKTETLKGIIINEPTLASANGNKSLSASKGNSAPADKLKNVKTKDDIPLCIVMKELNDLKLQINRNQSSYSKSNKPQQWFRRGEALQAKKAESSNVNRSKTPTK